MNEETLWGAICIVWVSVATVPYLYATVLTMIGKNETSDQIVDMLGLPWVVGFGGLLGLWAMEAHAAAGLVYSFAALILSIGWIFWKKASMKNVGEELSEGVMLDQAEKKERSGMLLSKTQRYILIAVAALVGIILIVQIEEVGLRDSPWMIGLLIVAALLLLAFAPRKN